MNSSKSRDSEVLIIGAGPTGLVLAVWLTRLGVRVRIVEKLAAPTTLKPGLYFIISSHDAGFREQDNQVSLATVWVSDLALVVVTREGHVEGFVLEAGSIGHFQTLLSTGRGLTAQRQQLRLSLVEELRIQDDGRPVGALEIVVNRQRWWRWR